MKDAEKELDDVKYKAFELEHLQALSVKQKEADAEERRKLADNVEKAKEDLEELVTFQGLLSFSFKIITEKNKCIENWKKIEGQRICRIEGIAGDLQNSRKPVEWTKVEIREKWPKHEKAKEWNVP